MLFGFLTKTIPDTTALNRTLACEWLFAGGGNSRTRMQEIIAGSSDAELAEDCMAAWVAEDAARWAAAGVSQTGLTIAFGWVRANFDAAFPPEQAA